MDIHHTATLRKKLAAAEDEISSLRFELKMASKKKVSFKGIT